jgi:hypothetical protein
MFLIKSKGLELLDKDLNLVITSFRLSPTFSNVSNALSNLKVLINCKKLTKVNSLDLKEKTIAIVINTGKSKINNFFIR